MLFGVTFWVNQPIREGTWPACSAFRSRMYAKEMGYQLWTSPLTGYRRKGTRLAELRALIQVGITARAILEPLVCCPAEAPAPAMAVWLDELGFDAAGVKAAEEATVVGFVLREDLEDGFVKDYVRTLDSDLLIADSTPLSGVLVALRNAQSYFVLLERTVEGIVTRADLNKPPVRTYLFGLISLLEMHLAAWVRVTYQDESWRAAISSERLRDAEIVKAQRATKDEDPLLLDCLQFCDRRDLVLRNRALREKLGLTPKIKSSDLLKQAEKLRNLLAHSGYDLAEGSSWEERIDLIHWVEDLLERSDDLIEKDAIASASHQL